MQFEVTEHRMAAEFGAKITLERLPYTVARAIDPDDVALVAKQVSMEVLTRTDGVMLALFTTKWRMQGFCEDNPKVRLSSLVAAGEN
jgi:peptide chain release factor 3